MNNAYLHPLHASKRRITSSRRLRTRLTRVVRVLKLIGALLLCHHFFRTLASFLIVSPLLEEENDRTGDVRWVRERTIKFTQAWSNHKLRNVASYTCLSTRHCFLLNAIVYRLFMCPEVFYDIRHDDLFEVPKLCFSHRCLKRFGRSHYVYAEFVLGTYDAVLGTPIEPPLPTEDGKIAVIIEPRRHPLLEYTIKQVITTLGADWSLQLFLSSENEHWVRRRLEIFKGGRGENIIVTSLAQFGLDQMSRYGNKVQSAFSAHARMYQALRSEHILWFQVDVVMRAEPPRHWLKYTFVGSEWYGCEYPTCAAHSCDNVCGGGNSGLSLRRRSKLKAVATRGTLPEDLWGDSLTHTSPFADGAYFDSDEFRDNSRTHWFEDDLQLSFKLFKLGLLPPGDIPRQFSIAQALPKNSSVRKVNPTGMHKPWMAPWIHPHVIMELLSDPFHRILLSNEIK